MEIKTARTLLFALAWPAMAQPGSPLGISWGMIYGSWGVKAEKFVPQVKQLGASFTKVYLFWNQIEPERGRYNWEAVDAYLNQLESPDEGLIALYSSSTWATRKPTQFWPPSPARNPDDYYRFVHDLVAHAKGRVRYFQNDCEPNNPMFWSGTKEEYLAQLRVFHRAVKDADAKALVVLGGYDGVFNPPGLPPIPGQDYGLSFFDFLLKEGAKLFDVFDIRLYANPYTIPARVEYMRQKMIQPVISTEYNGPGFFEFPANRRYYPLLQSWSQSVTSGDAPARQNEITALYEKMATLPPETQMFMMGCPERLEQKRQRIQARDLVMRNALALSAGVQKMLYWDLWHDTRKRDDLMTLLYGKLKLMDYEGGTLKKRYPAADAFRRMAAALDGVESVRRVPAPGNASIFVFEVKRRKREPVYIAWEKRDAMSGEESPDVPFELEWRWPAATAFDALGQSVVATVNQGRLKMGLSLTPVFIEGR